MAFWILIAALTAIASLSVLVPLSRSGKVSGGGAQGADEAVYREQLSAIDSELERGLIDAQAAEAARTEIARRLLSAHENRDVPAVSGMSTARLRLVQALGIVAVPIAALVLYLNLGSPGRPDLPLEARLNAPVDGQSVDALLARVEKHLSENPEDGEGWAVIAPVYLTIGQPQASARAYANAMRILGPRVDWLADFAEALTVANRGIVTAEAREAFERAVDLDPGAVKPRFFLAIALEQDGKTEEAIAAWEELLAGADDQAAWVQAARQQLAGLTGEAPAGTAPRGPSQEDVAASRDMSSDDRQAMIEGMVSGLAERLDSEGGTPQEWTQLMRAYIVLGEREKAETTFARAQTAFAESPAELATIKDAAGKLGLDGS